MTKINYKFAFLPKVADEDGILGIFIPLDQLESYFGCRAYGSLHFERGWIVCENQNSRLRNVDGFGKTWRDVSNAGNPHSWGHTQHGYICAGAGGLNSKPILKLAKG